MRNAAILLAAILGLTVLAGCTSHGSDPKHPAADGPDAAYVALTNATHGFGRFISTSVASFDGTALHIDLQLPDGDGPFPTIMTDTPYAVLGENAAGLRADHGQPFSGGAAEFVPLGYAVAIAHVRGTGESGGCLTIGDPVEGQDGYALVEWIANQSWSNGKVAMMGTSYDGTTPLETAVWQPPHLTTIVPISPVTEWYRYYFELGTHRRNADPFPGSSDTDPLLWGAIGIAPGVRTGATGGVQDVQCPAQYAVEDDGQDDYDAYWHARDHHAKAGNITTPMLFAHGWEDGNVAPPGFPSLWANVTSEKRLWVEQHGHGVPASKTAYHEYVHRWMDYWLLGRQNGALLLPPVIIEDNNGKFRAEQDWPPADTSVQHYNLSAKEMPVTFPPTPAPGGVLPYVDEGAANEADTTPVPDHITFRTPPLPYAMHIAGAPTLNLHAAADMPDAQLDVNLYDLAPDGTQTYVSRGFLDGRHHESLDLGTDLVRGQYYDFHFPLHPNDHVVPSGNQLVLVLKGSDDYVQRTPYRNTMLLNVTAGLSWLDLPFLADENRTFLAAAPAPWES